MTITKRELYLEACKYAVEEKGGSDWFFVITRDGKRHIVLWSKVIEWLNDKLEDASNAEFHCGVEESGGHAYNCNDCPNKCDEFNQWDKEFKEKGDLNNV